MIIFRYFAREVFASLSAVTAVLLLIFLSNRFVHYLGAAVVGKLPAMVVAQLTILQIPHFLGLLLPLGMYIGILLAYGRLYVDSEMAVLYACGMSRKQLLGYTLIIALAVMLVVAVINLWLSPKVLSDKERLMEIARSASIVDTIAPGRFQYAAGGKQIYYVENISRDRTKVNTVFMAQRAKHENPKDNLVDPWHVMSAETGHINKNEDTGERFVVLKNGYRYHGKPGQKDFRIIKFGSHHIRLEIPQPTMGTDEQAMSTRELWSGASNPRYAAELQWRLSAPLSVLVLALIAVPMSRVKPRKGKYVQLIPATLIYIVYANLMIAGKAWVEEGIVPTYIGLWWVHACAIVVGLSIFYLPQIKLLVRAKRKRAAA